MACVLPIHNFVAETTWCVVENERIDPSSKQSPYYWVAVKELKLSYYIGETLLFTIYTHSHYGHLI